MPFDFGESEIQSDEPKRVEQNKSSRAHYFSIHDECISNELVLIVFRTNVLFGNGHFTFRLTTAHCQILWISLVKIKLDS